MIGGEEEPHTAGATSGSGSGSGDHGTHHVVARARPQHGMAVLIAAGERQRHMVGALIDRRPRHHGPGRVELDPVHPLDVGLASPACLQVPGIVTGAAVLVAEHDTVLQHRVARPAGHRRLGVPGEQRGVGVIVLEEPTGLRQ